MRLVALVLLLFAVAVTGAGGSTRKVEPCHSAVRTGVLPVWARSGFSDKQPRMAYELGRAGRIAALLFANPLVVPPYANRNNKILWVARISPSAPADLRISAQRMAGSTRLGAPVARRVMGGPGPSIINLPAAGCWRLTLRWGRRSDVLDLVYRAS